MDGYLFLLIIAMALPGVSFMILSERKIIKERNSGEDEYPIYVGFLVHLLIVSLFAGIGVLLLDKTSFSLNEINFISIGVGVVVAVVHLLYYYGFLAKNVEKEVLLKIDTARNQLGILTRVFYGGVVEEIIFRWGLMSLVIWLGSFVFGASDTLNWCANVLAAVFFGLAHLPGAKQILGKNIPIITIYSMLMNFLVGIACGWLFLNAGLIGAIVCHMLFHIVWYAYERIMRKDNRITNSIELTK
ncbi:CPBP family intramembrane glutamic endopeptidase [Peribacillus acanthi]|uniref:CPBP family intramembrane glutamic endopeptidase n=1 Tax=Peribacillus acanthi TaxID=2171554 RepID=UPI000D3EBC30|nr:CPBP family intramembrane glutamic endopeptidase [Peribacillus acanthi]